MYGALTKDYIGALDRRKQYQPEKFHAGLDAQKMRREAQRASLNLLQQSVTDCMQGLNGLGDVRPYDRSLKNLSNNLNQATLLTHGEKEAVGALSTILARAVTAGYRRHEIRKPIHGGNQPLQDVINATRKIVMKRMVICKSNSHWWDGIMIISCSRLAILWNLSQGSQGSPDRSAWPC